METRKILLLELDTPAGEFDNVLKTKETRRLSKCHADGIGLIKDGDLEMVSCSGKLASFFKL
ncbi:MAG: hypothetical protein DA330_05260 [Nitrososphaera sp.]|nr:hypothetical protein [Nitrososphaera sp.]